MLLYHFKTEFISWCTELLKMTHHSWIHLLQSDNQALRHTEGGMGYTGLQSTGTPCLHRAEERVWEDSLAHQSHLCNPHVHHISLTWGHTAACKHKQTHPLHRLGAARWQNLQKESKWSHVGIRRVFSLYSIKYPRIHLFLGKHQAFQSGNINSTQHLNTVKRVSLVLIMEAPFLKKVSLIWKLIFSNWRSNFYSSALKFHY